MVYADIAEFVDQDGGFGHVGVSQQMVQQRCLAAAEKAGQQRHLDTGVFAFRAIGLLGHFL